MATELPAPARKPGRTSSLTVALEELAGTVMA